MNDIRRFDGFGRVLGKERGSGGDGARTSSGHDLSYCSSNCIEVSGCVVFCISLARNFGYTGMPNPSARCIRSFAEMQYGSKFKGHVFRTILGI